MKKDADFEFTPRLGRIRSRGNLKRAKGFLSKVTRAAKRAGPAGGRRGSSSGHGQPGHAGYGRRVIVKARIVRMAASSAGALAAHLSYISRDSALREEDRGKVFGRLEDDADRADFARRAEDDRHHFRFIVSPEDGAEIDDLKPLVRDLVSAMEQDLETRLDWVAAVHHNTSHPHAHIVIRGRRDDGRDLVIPRAYMSHGIRGRASELVTRELGLETRQERARNMALDMEAERFTNIDRAMLRAAGTSQLLDVARAPPSYRQINLSRLRVLERMRLAEQKGRSLWQLSPKLETTLKTLSERGEIMKQLGAATSGRKDRRLDPDFAMRPDDSALSGIVADLRRGCDYHDRQFAVLDAFDGRLVRAKVDVTEGLKKGMVVTLLPPSAEPKPSDITIQKIASLNNGRYSPALHQAEDSRASPQFVGAHVRRLEAVRRAGIARRFTDGSWVVPADYLEQVGEWDRGRAMKGPVTLRVESYLSLEAQVQNVGLTWLDELGAIEEPRLGVLQEIGVAAQRRRQVLIDRGSLTDRDLPLSKAERQRLRQAGREAAIAQVSKATGKSHATVSGDGRVEGVFARTVDTGQGRLAVIEKGTSFILVPWHGALERARGKEIVGAVKANVLNWSLAGGRVRGRGR